MIENIFEKELLQQEMEESSDEEDSIINTSTQATTQYHTFRS